MSLPRSIEQRSASHAVLTLPRAAVCAVIAALLLLSACGTLDRFRGKKPEPPPTTSPSSGSPAAPPEPTVDEKGRSLLGRLTFGRKKKAEPTPQTAATPRPKAAVPLQARVEFDRAVGLMRSGKDVEAQLEFARIAKAYPQLASPDVNLGILYRKAGNLEKSEEALQEAVSRDRESAIAWNELGVTQRMRGDFKTAQDSYENAIRVDPDFAPAYRNLGVLLDLYMGDAEGALDNFERYKELSKEEKPVTGWIAELRQRTGRSPIRNKPVAPASDSAPAEGSSDNVGASPAATPSTSQDATPAEPKRG